MKTLWVCFLLFPFLSGYCFDSYQSVIDSTILTNSKPPSLTSVSPGSTLSAKKNRKLIFNGFTTRPENDSLFPYKNKDENYTGQFQFELFLDENFLRINKFSFPFIRNNKTISQNKKTIFALGKGYTPSHLVLSETEPVLNDQPYASYLSAGVQRTAWWDRTMVTTELTLGTIGSPRVGEFQNWIHRNVTKWSGPVLGWDNQIAYPGRFAFYYRMFGRQQLNELPVANEKIRVMAFNFDIMAGTFMTYLTSGIGISNINKDNIWLSNSFKDGLLPNGKPKKVILKYQFNADFRLVGHNTILMGFQKNSTSIHKISTNEIKRVVFVPSIKWQLLMPRPDKKNSFILGWYWNYRSQEFNSGKMGHFWGTLSISTFWK